MAMSKPKQTISWLVSVIVALVLAALVADPYLKRLLEERREQIEIANQRSWLDMNIPNRTIRTEQTHEYIHDNAETIQHNLYSLQIDVIDSATWEIKTSRESYAEIHLPSGLVVDNKANGISSGDDCLVHFKKVDWSKGMVLDGADLAPDKDPDYRVTGNYASTMRTDSDDDAMNCVHTVGGSVADRLPFVEFPFDTVEKAEATKIAITGYIDPAYIVRVEKQQEWLDKNIPDVNIHKVTSWASEGTDSRVTIDAVTKFDVKAIEPEIWKVHWVRTSNRSDNLQGEKIDHEGKCNVYFKKVNWSKANIGEYSPLGTVLGMTESGDQAFLLQAYDPHAVICKDHWNTTPPSDEKNPDAVFGFKSREDAENARQAIISHVATDQLR